MKAREFKKEAKKLGIEVLKARIGKRGIRVTYAAIIDTNTISIPQERFYHHWFLRDFTYEEILEEWSR